MNEIVKEHGTGDASAEDNWPSRSRTHECWSCLYFVSKNSGSLGRCRRSAPTMGGFPVVYQSDWCGEHKLIRLN